jgi:5-oxoprolinase (ATP-hydrolysing) subunit C
MAEAQAEAKKFADLLRSLPDRLREIESIELNIEALRDANVAGSAVSAVDAHTWHAATSRSPHSADLASPEQEGITP